MFYLRILYVLLLFVSVDLFAQQSFDYDLFLDQEKHGAIQVIYHQQNSKTYTLEETSFIKISGLWSSINLQGVLKEKHSADGAFISSSNHIKEDDDTHWQKIKRSDNTLMVSNSDNPNKHKVIKMGFDTSLLNLPYFWKKSEFNLPNRLNILDSEDVTVFTADVVHIGSETLRINKTSYSTEHYQLIVKDSNASDIWLALDQDSFPYFVKTQGKDDDGSYQLILSSKNKDK